MKKTYNKWTIRWQEIYIDDFIVATHENGRRVVIIINEPIAEHTLKNLLDELEIA